MRLTLVCATETLVICVNSSVLGDFAPIGQTHAVRILKRQSMGGGVSAMYFIQG